jgi:hypothetical protein
VCRSCQATAFMRSLFTAKSLFIYLLVVAVDNTHGSPGTIFRTDHVLSAMCKLWKSDHRLPLQRGGDSGVFFSRPFLPCQVYFNYEEISSINNYQVLHSGVFVVNRCCSARFISIQKKTVC